MELRQLVYFEAVARFGGFTRASDHLRIAQPAVSAQIKQLEHELGVSLLRRTSRRVALTEAGELFLVRARRVLSEIDAARDDVDDLAAVLRGRVALGATGVVGAFDLPAALASFTARFPGVSLSLRSGLLPDLVAGLRSGALDLVVAPLEPGLVAAGETHPLASDRLALLSAPGRLPASSPVDIARLVDAPFVSLPLGTGLRDVVNAAVPGAHVAFEVDTAAHVRALVAAGLGVALMPASAATGPGPRVDVHDIDPPVDHPPFGLAWREPTSPAARALRSHLIDTRENSASLTR